MEMLEQEDRFRKYQVLVKSTAGFIVEAESKEHAEEMVLTHMNNNGISIRKGVSDFVEYWDSESPFYLPIRLSITLDGSGGDKILSTKEIAGR